jgi:hypothetical protein
MKIIPMYLIISALITMFILYMFYPEPDVLLVEPDINKDISIVYQDDNDVCYRYHKKEIKCKR